MKARIIIEIEIDNLETLRSILEAIKETKIEAPSISNVAMKEECKVAWELYKYKDSVMLRLKKGTMSFSVLLDRNDIKCLLEEPAKCIDAIVTRDRKISPSTLYHYRSMLRDAIECQELVEKLREAYEELYWREVDRIKNVLERDRKMQLELLREG